MNCFICSTYIEEWKKLLRHFRFAHSLQRFSEYQCTYKNCGQFFQDQSIFGGHYKKHIDRENSFRNESILSNCENTDLSSVLDLSLCASLLPPVSVNVPDHSFSSSSMPIPEPSKSFRELGVIFAMSLHNKDNIVRKDIENIQQNVVRNIVDPIVHLVRGYAESNFELQIEQRINFEKLLFEISNPFAHCLTEHRLFNWLCENNFMSNFQEFTINNELTEVFHKGEIVSEEKVTTGVLMPLRFQFTKVFEQNDLLLRVMKEILAISNYDQDHKFCNFLQGKLWKIKTEAFSGKIAIPFFIYIDDVEINNPLGSHTDAMTMIYYSFPIFNATKLEKIYLGSVFKAKHYKQFGNDNCLRCLIDELQFLEKEGIDIKTSEGTKRVHFILGLVLGDNLGLNSILGLTQSFSANYFCRFCKDHKSNTHKMTSENPLTLRTLDNYEQDVALNDMKLTGIKEKSILNSIDTFNVVTNYAIDIMHDFFEGVCHYDICHIITYLIDLKYFSLKQLNTRKQMLNYGEIEINNVSPEITSNDLQRNHLKMTAREMMCFIHFFPLMVGDIVSEKDEVWLFFLNLLDINDILLSFDISRDILDLLKFKIRQHHLDYVRIFNDTLKPKHHLMVHYHSVILYSGPPRNYWCFRFEAKHRQFKMYARATSCRKNVPITLARKFQLKFAYYFMHPEADDVTVESSHAIYSAYDELILSSIPSNSITQISYKCLSECIYKGNKYKNTFILSKFVDRLIFFEIKEIVIFIDKQTPYVVCKQIFTDKYYQHYSSYSVDFSHDDAGSTFQVLSIDSFAGPPVNFHKIATGLNMIRLKEHF